LSKTNLEISMAQDPKPRGGGISIATGLRRWLVECHRDAVRFDAHGAIFWTLEVCYGATLALE
jgi:hypothetical protein